MGAVLTGLVAWLKKALHNCPFFLRGKSRRIKGQRGYDVLMNLLTLSGKKKKKKRMCGITDRLVWARGRMLSIILGMKLLV